MAHFSQGLAKDQEEKRCHATPGHGIGLQKSNGLPYIQVVHLYKYQRKNFTYTMSSPLTPSPPSSVPTVTALSLDLGGLGFPISLSGTAVAALPLGVDTPHSLVSSLAPRLPSELCSSLVSTQIVSSTKIEFLLVRAFLLLRDFWLSIEVRVSSLVMGYLSKALEPREPIVGGCWLLDLLGSEEEEGCLW